MAQFDFKQAIAKVEANKPKPAPVAPKPGYNSDGSDSAVWGELNKLVPEADAKLAGIASQTAANQAQKLSGYEQQLAAAQAGEQDFAVREGMISKEATAAARNLNRQGAAIAARNKNLGQSRGQAREFADTRAQMDTAYGRQQLENAAQRRAAQQQAGALQSTLAEEKQRALVQQTTGKQDALNQMYAQIDEIEDSTNKANPVHLSDGEVMQAAEEMRRKVLPGATSAEERAAIEAYIQQYIADNT
jgi:cell fate (sporulation/competence/biofilm development) regulator YmcA (YheA/YmcA/DUF963 family)